MIDQAPLPGAEPAADVAPARERVQLRRGDVAATYDPSERALLVYDGVALVALDPADARWLALVALPALLVLDRQHHPEEPDEA